MEDRLVDTAALARICAEHGLARQALARNAGVSYSTLKYILAGRQPRGYTIHKIANALGCDYTDITRPQQHEDAA